MNPIKPLSPLILIALMMTYCSTKQTDKQKQEEPRYEIRSNFRLANHYKTHAYRKDSEGCLHFHDEQGFDSVTICGPYTIHKKD